MLILYKYGMRIFEVTDRQFDPLLVEFWQRATPEQLKYYFVQNNCYGASQDFSNFLETKGLGHAETIPIGRITNGKKQYGWFRADVPDLTYDALERRDLLVMREQGLNPRSKPDRVAYIQNNNLEEDFKWIPHSWVEIRGQILDPSGFYIDGRSGQFDRMVTDKTNLSQRYKYF